MNWQPPERPRWAERLIAHGHAVGGATHLVSLDPDELIHTASQSTGLDDFGAQGWREPYTILLRALEQESNLHLVGRTIVRSEILRTLQNRLKLAALWGQRPASKASGS